MKPAVGPVTSLGAWLLVTAVLCAQDAETVDDLVSRYFNAAGDDERAAVLRTIESRKDVTIQQVEDAVRRGVFYKPQPSGTVTRRIKVELDGSETDCTFHAPQGYDPRKSYPALVIMHGTGGTGEGFLSRWLSHAEKRGMIVIAPTAVSGIDKPSGKPFGKGHGYGTQEIERSVPISAINAARRLYNIDSDRIYITGVSMGGHATWDSVITRTDTFAGAIPEAGIPLVEGFQLAKYMFLPNLFQVRMFVVQGTPDKDQPKVNAEATGRLKTLGYAAEYRQIEGRGHNTYPEDSDDALDYVMAVRRDVYCKKLTKVTHRLIHGRAYWVSIDKMRTSEWDPRRHMDIKVDGPISNDELLKRVEEKIKDQLGYVEAEVLDDNVIKIKTRNVRELTVCLHDKLVDMDKPVTVKINRQTPKRFPRVKRDVRYMLEEVRRTTDTRRIFYNELKLPVF